MTRSLAILDQTARLLARAAGSAVVRTTYAVLAWVAIVWHIVPDIGPPRIGQLFLLLWACGAVEELWKLRKP